MQDSYKCLKPKYLSALAELTNLPLTEIYETASFYAHFDIFKDDDVNPEVTIRVYDNGNRNVDANLYKKISLIVLRTLKA